MTRSEKRLALLAAAAALAWWWFRRKPAPLTAPVYTVDPTGGAAQT